MAEVTNIVSGEDDRPSTKSPAGWASFWNSELKASERMLRDFRKQGNRVVREYLDDRSAGEADWFKLNLFNANINTLKSMLYGNLPEVTVSRKFADQDDDVARVAANIIQRMLNQDLQANGDEYDVVLRGVLEDRLVPGLGCAVVRYHMETTTDVIDSKTSEIEEDDDEEEEPEEYLDWEDATVDYHFWGDVSWSWSRNWSELRWVAFRSHLTKEKATARFGGAVASRLTYKKETPSADASDPYNRDLSDSVSTAAIWEIWDKESETVFWHQENQPLICDQKEDPLDLEGFFPCPPFFVANTSTSLYKPTSDYWMAKDLYREVNRLETRIALITEAVKVVGVYDKQQEGVQRMLREGNENDLIPIDNWAMFAEKGGIAGAIAMFPALDVANTLERLVAQRNDAINLLYQVTGMSDILRGAASQGGVSATEQELKAKFSSIRVQALQDGFAKFASDLMQIKAEIICKHYDPMTIVQQSNVQGMNKMDQQLVPQAIQLIKNPEQMYFRVSIKPESVAMVDFAKKQQERTQYIEALGFFLQSATPIVKEEPSTAPFMMELLKWGLAGFKGSEQIEGVVDAAIEQMQKNPPQQKGDPKAEAEQAKQQGAMQLEQLKQQGAMQNLQSQMQLSNQKHSFEMEQLKAKYEVNMAELKSEFISTMAEIQAQLTGKVEEQRAQTTGKLIETAAQTEAKLTEQANAVRTSPKT